MHPNNNKYINIKLENNNINIRLVTFLTLQKFSQMNESC